MNYSLNHSLYITIKKHINTSFWPLFVAAFILILIGIGLRDPWPADEPRFALIAKEMVETGQWFFPARAQELYPDKPPIFMWTIALFYWLTGSLRVSFLLPSALCSLLTIFLVYDITKRLWDSKTGLVAGWLLLFSLQFMLQAKTAQIDAMVCAWITVGCYGLLRYCLVDGYFKWYALAWFFMGVGVITKGVGFLPLLMLVPYIAYRLSKPTPETIVTHKMWSWLSGPLFMLIAIGLWLVPMLIIVSQSDNTFYETYRDNIVFRQTLTRYADPWHHIKPAWYYLTSVIPVFWLPCILALPWLIRPWLTSIKEHDARIILPLGFVILLVLFFSISPGKRGVYLLPALPMFILVVAPFYRLLMNKITLRRVLYYLCLLFSCGLIFLAVLGHYEFGKLTQITSKLEIVPWLFFFVVGITSLWGTLMFHHQQQWLAWPLLMTILWITYCTYGYSLRNDVSTPIKIFENINHYVKSENIQSPNIALVDFSEQFVLFSPYPIIHFGYNTVIEAQLSSAYKWQVSANQFLLVEDKIIKGSCYDIDKLIDLGFAHRRHWVLVPVDAKLTNCEISDERLPLYQYHQAD